MRKLRHRIILNLPKVIQLDEPGLYPGLPDSNVCALTHFANFCQMLWRSKYWNTQKAGVATPVSGRADSRERDVIRDAEGCFIPIKGPVLQEDTAILKVYVPNNRASSYVRRKLTERRGKADKSVLMVRDFSVPPAAADPADGKSAWVKSGRTVPSVGWMWLTFIS